MRTTIYNAAYDEEAMEMVRKLLAAAHQMEVGEKDTIWADALGARAANILAGVVRRTERRQVRLVRQYPVLAP